MLISEREDALFEMWSKHRPQFVRDGLVDEAAYLASSPRTVLVLKDVNSVDGGGWDLRDVLRRTPRWQTWNTVTRWMRGLQNLDRDLTWPEIAAKPLPMQAPPMQASPMRGEPPFAPSVSSISRRSPAQRLLLSHVLMMHLTE